MTDRTTKLLLAIIAAALVAINVQVFFGAGLAGQGASGPTFADWRAASLLQKNRIKDQAPIVVDLR